MEDAKSIVASAKALLVANRRTMGEYTFTIPSPYEYRHQWLWDSCFHAIALRHFDTNAAEGELTSLLASQRRNGMVPHESKYSILGMPVPYTSRITQPPFIARAALDVYNKSKNMEFLSAAFPKLQRYYNWLENEREREGVLTVVDPDESGEDNSILWDDELTFPIHRTLLRWLPTYVPLFPHMARLKSVTATSIYADALECMSAIAKIVNDSKAAAAYMQRRNSAITAMKETFGKNNPYLSITSKNKQISYLTHDIFSPLFAGAMTKKEAKQLVDGHLLNEKEFWTPYAIPTVAINEPRFSAEGYWRGPMWININWMLHRGLLRYGFRDAATELLNKTIAAVKKSGFREYYNPLTGEGLGAKQFGWSTLVVDMMKTNRFI